MRLSALLGTTLAFGANAAGDEAYGYPIYGTGSVTNLGSFGLITLGNNINANYLVQAGGGSALTPAVQPRHRGTVQRFFERNPKR